MNAYDQPLGDQPLDQRLRQAFAAPSNALAPGEPCPEPDVLWAAARAELIARERVAIIDHTSRCPSCAEDFRIAKALAADAPRDVGLPVSPAAPEASWWRRLIASPRALPAPVFGLAAAALVVLAVGLGWRLAGPTPADFRSADGDAVRTLLAPEEILPRTGARLRWSGVEGARYDVAVTTAGLEAVAQARDLERPELELAASTLEGLPAGTVLRWQVEARLADGRRLSSPTFSHRLEDE